MPLSFGGTAQGTVDASVLMSELRTSIGKKLPRYPFVPVVRIERVAIDEDFKGQGPVPLSLPLEEKNAH